jgi:DNA mismatch repair protein MSH6
MLEDAMAKRGDGDYIPNTVVLGNQIQEDKAFTCYNGRLLLLSGPNMGGKSTLLRQTCLIALLAQLGCKVPADSVTMTPVDRIFTRVGASDRILAGQSTFFVELAETAVMLRQATEDSLGILDELGRGTATFDGTAIAHACVEHIVRETRCRTLFATHYHSLIDDWTMDPRVQLGHMQCLVEGADDVPAQGGAEGVDGKMDAVEEVMFLYHLASGGSPRSYGINVARLAKLPADVISLALAQSREFEEKMKLSEAAKAAADGMHEGGSRKRMQAFFDRLVSVSHADMPLEELVVIASEIWQRYQKG